MAARAAVGVACRRLWQVTGEGAGRWAAGRLRTRGVPGLPAARPARGLLNSQGSAWDGWTAEGGRGGRSPGIFSLNHPKNITSKRDVFLLHTHMKWVQFSCLHMDVRTGIDKPKISVSDEPDTLYKRLSVLVKGHDRAVLDSYEYFAVLAAKELGISIKKVHEPPRKIERFTLLKSVHIFKKHRVQYEMRTYYRCLELQHITGSTADVYLEYIQRNLPEGVAMEVTKTRLEQLPEHIKEPLWKMVGEDEKASKA